MACLQECLVLQICQCLLCYGMFELCKCSATPKGGLAREGRVAGDGGSTGRLAELRGPVERERLSMGA